MDREAAPEHLGRVEEPPEPRDSKCHSHSSGLQRSQHIPRLHLHTYLTLGVKQRLLGVQTGMCHLDNMLQLPRLLLHLGCQEKRCWHHRLWRKTLCLLKRSLNSRLKQINQVDSQYSFRKRRLFESSHRQEREEGPSPCPNPFPRWAPHPGSSRSGFGVPSTTHPPDPSTYIPVELGEGLHHVEAVHVHDGRVDGELGAGKGVKEQQQSCCPALCIPEARTPLSHYPMGSWSTGMRNLAERFMQTWRQSFSLSCCVEDQASPTRHVPEELPQQSPAQP